jgi:DnaJ domain
MQQTMQSSRASIRRTWHLECLASCGWLCVVCVFLRTVASFTTLKVPRQPRAQQPMLDSNANALWGPSMNHIHVLRTGYRGSKGTSTLFMAGSSGGSSPDWSSSDPWRVLGISRAMTGPTDAKEVKRVYKRLAMRFHPDVVTTKDSTAQEKKVASDRFAKINWAYSTIMEQLSSSTATGSAYSRSSSSSNGSRSSSSSGWEPPHRRTSSYYEKQNRASSSSSSSGGPSTDWRDYMPNSDYKETYDTGGDSLGQIFSDFIQGAAAGVNGGSGIFKDFVDFLEQNVEAYSPGAKGDNTDADLQMLLQTGTVPEVGDEMDETELVVQQLSQKLSNIQTETMQVQADLAVAASGSSYRERLALQERLDELQARQSVVQGYQSRARRRLVALQTRYKELVVSGQDDARARGKAPGGGPAPPRGSTTTSDSSGSGTSQRQSSSPSPAPADTDAPTPSTSSGESWKEEGFGSFGRGRGSSGRRRASASTSDSSSARTSSSSSSPGPDKVGASAASSRSPPPPPRSATTTRTSTNAVPPHRRTSSSYADKVENERRLREIKVDEEFDKLKRELGLK